MSFSWNKWRQYIIEEASVNEEVDEVGEIIPFFHDAMKMDLIRSIDYQRAVEAGGESEDLNHFESTQEFQQIGKDIIMAAVDALEKSGRETHYLHQKFAQGGGGPIEGADISNAVGILKKGGKINPEADEIDPEDLDAAADYFDNMEEAYDVEMSDVVRNPKHGFMPDKILKSFIEDFEKASMSTDDIPYAQETVIDAYMKTFPHMDQFIQLWLDQNHNKELKKFQNVADDPDTVGTDVMSEAYKLANGKMLDFSSLEANKYGDAFEYAEYTDGTKLTPAELDDLRDEEELMHDFFGPGGPGHQPGSDFMENEQVLDELINELVLEEGFLDRLGAKVKGGAAAVKQVGKNVKATVTGDKDSIRSPKEASIVSKTNTFRKKTIKALAGYSDDLAKVIKTDPKDMSDDVKKYVSNVAKVMAKAASVLSGLAAQSPIKEEESSQVVDEAEDNMAMHVASKLDAMQNDLEATLSDDELDTLSDAIMLLRQKKTLNEKVAVSNDPFLKALEAELAKVLTDEEVNILTTLAKEQMNESPMAAGTGIKLATQYLLRRVLGPIILGPLVTKIFDKMATKFPEKKELILKMEPIVQGAIAAGKIGSIIELNKFIRANSEELSEMLVTMSSEMAAMLKDTVKGLVKRK